MEEGARNGRACVCTFWLAAVTVRWTPKSGHTIGAIEAFNYFDVTPSNPPGPVGASSHALGALVNKDLFFRIDPIVIRNYAIFRFILFFCQKSLRVQWKKKIRTDCARLKYSENLGTCDGYYFH